MHWGSGAHRAWALLLFRLQHLAQTLIRLANPVVLFCTPTHFGQHDALFVGRGARVLSDFPCRFSGSPQLFGSLPRRFAQLAQVFGRLPVAFALFPATFGLFPATFSTQPRLFADGTLLLSVLLIVGGQPMPSAPPALGFRLNTLLVSLPKAFLRQRALGFAARSEERRVGK